MSLRQHLLPVWSLGLFRPGLVASATGVTAVARAYYGDWRSEAASKWHSDEEIEKARKWVKAFKVEDIPRKACVVRHSASSGPGGQNVNKLATKATLHLDLDPKVAGTFLPDYILRKVRENSRHLTKDGQIVLQADSSRKQSDNDAEAFRRLHSIIVSCVHKDVPGATSADQKKRVAQLQKADANLRKKMKNFQKSKKDSRRNRQGDD